MGLGKLFCQKTGHWGFFFYTEPHIYSFQQCTYEICRFGINLLLDRFNIQSLQEIINPVPETDRFALGYKISITGCSCSRM